MATYYVDYVNGLDANNGLGPDASHATNKPWKTVNKLLGAAGMASGDTAYLAPGSFREVMTVAMTSAVAETKIIGDVANLRGFKTAAGVLVPPGHVIHTSYITNDTTAPSASAPIILAGRDFLTFEDIIYVGGTSTPMIINASATVTSQNIVFTRCTFLAPGGGANAILWANTTAGEVATWTLDSCIFLSRNAGGFHVRFNASTSAGAPYDLNIQIKNCVFLGSGGPLLGTIGTDVGKPGGMDMFNSTFIGAGLQAFRTLANSATTIPCTIYNCFIYGGNINAAAAGQITDDYNLMFDNVNYTNVTQGTNSKIDFSRAPLFEFGQAPLSGFLSRAPFTPMKVSPLLGYGNQAGGPTVDMLGLPRPAGGGSASAGIGAFERGDTWGKETTTVRTGSNALSVTGPGTQDFQLPVDVLSTTVTVYLRKDSTYAGTAPKLQIRNGLECGVADAEDTLGAAADTWEQQSLNFTPTSQGIVTVRLLSTDTNGGGKAFADDFSVA